VLIRFQVINPGVPPDNMYFSIADTICVVENKYSYWKTDDCQNRLSKIEAPNDRRCIIIHSATGLNRSGFRDLTNDLQKKAGSLFVTDQDRNYYEKWGKNYPLAEFIGDISR
jgi:hypothetical protein